MSLFGGPLSLQTPANARHEPSPYFRSSSLPLPPSSPPRLSDHGDDDDDPVSPIERDRRPGLDGQADDANDDDESGSEYTDSTDSECTRPRFRGYAQTYNRHTQAERALAESLAKLRAEDLSLHLYDTHALKRRLDSERAAKKVGGKEAAGLADDDSDDGEKRWRPRRQWTAWPLEPENVPRPHERFAALPTIDPEEEFTFRRAGYERQRPIRDIKEILVGLVQKNARERWDKKEWEDHEDPEAPEGSDVEEMDIDGAKPSRGTSASRAATPTGSRREFIMDDDAAYETLDSTTRSIVGKLNKILTDVHERGRRYARSKKFWEGTNTATDTEASRSRSRKRRKKTQSASEGETKVKRPRGRPPKPVSQTPGPDSTPHVTEGEGNETSASAQKRKPGRPRKERLAGESYYMRKKRERLEREGASGGQLPHAGSSHPPSSRAQTTEPEPDSSRPPTPNPSALASIARAQSNDFSSDEDDDAVSENLYYRRGGKALPLKDWRDVLGTASSLGGFSEAVIERAMRRCTELFGQDATVRAADDGTADQVPAEQGPPDEEVAGEDAVLEEGPGEGPSGQGPTEVEAVKKVPKKERGAPLPASELPPGDTDYADDEEERDGEDRPVWDGSMACPHPDCERHTEPYTKLFRLREHVKRKHKYKLDAPRMNAKGRKRRAQPFEIPTKKGKEKGKKRGSEKTAAACETKSKGKEKKMAE